MTGEVAFLKKGRAAGGGGGGGGGGFSLSTVK